MAKWKKTEILLNHKSEEKPVPIITDGVIANRDLADGRMIPLLIIDTSQRHDIEDMVLAHYHFNGGDAESAWSIPSKRKTDKISLILNFHKPSHCIIVLGFDIERQGGVVDQIMEVQGVYLQPGESGDRLSRTLEHNRILVEVPSKHLKKEWNNIFSKALIRKFKREGLSRSEAKKASDTFIKEWRKIGHQGIGPR
jgi:hypothetical protein